MNTTTGRTLGASIVIVMLAFASSSMAQADKPQIGGTYYSAKDSDLPPKPFNPYTPSTGEYVVTITHKGTLVDGAQFVSIVIDGNIAQAAPTHQITSFVETGTDEFTIVWPTVVGANYQIQSTTDFTSWSGEGGEISPLTTTTAVALTGGAQHKFFRILRLR